MKLYTIVLFFVCAIPFVAQTQTISNVTAKQESDNIIITYTLQAEKEQYIELLLSKDGGKTFGEKPLGNLIGNVGFVTAGTNKKVIWNATKSESVLYGNNFVFRVQINSKATSFANYTEAVAGVSFDMIAVKGGTFKMGSTENSGEQPIHDVTLFDFYIGKYEVTNAQFAAFLNDYGSDKVKSGEYKDQTIISEYKWGVKKNRNTWQAQVGYEKHPVIYVTWYGANEYCTWLSQKNGKKYSLPSEAQWEYAAGGGANNRTKWAGINNENGLGNFAWYSSNSNSTTYEIGTTQKPNSFGIYDMSGNVWEWCMDTWHGTYENARINGSAWIDNSSSSRVLRGGSWDDRATNCRVANRSGWNPSYGYGNLGFRLVVLR